MIPEYQRHSLITYLPADIHLFVCVCVCVCVTAVLFILRYDKRRSRSLGALLAGLGLPIILYVYIMIYSTPFFPPSRLIDRYWLSN